MATNGLSRARRMVADEARIHFLAGAALAGDQHRGIVLRDLARQRHQRASTPDPTATSSFGATRARQLALRHVDQRLRVEGLDDVVGRAFAHGRHRLRDGAVGGHQHHRQIRPQPLDGRQAARSRSAPGICTSEMTRAISSLGSSCSALACIGGGERRQAGGAQRVDQGLAQRGVVLDHQDRFVQCAHAIVLCR